MYAALPAAVLIGIALSAIWGENGLLEWRRLEQARVEASEQLAAIQRNNQRKQRKIRLMMSDPIVMERIIADQLGWGREGSELFKFEDTSPE